MADRARGLTTTFAARARNTPSPDDAPNPARRPGATRETRDSALSVDTAPARPYRVSALIDLRDGAQLMPPLPLPTSPRPLSPGRALGLLVAANLADEGRGTIRAACLHRVLIVEVRQPGAGAYRSAPTVDGAAASLRCPLRTPPFHPTRCTLAKRSGDARGFPSCVEVRHVRAGRQGKAAARA